MNTTPATARPPANAATAQARTVVDELVRGGVRHLVLSPGSRSAALAYAAHQADRDGRLTLHTRIDERTAGFLALGLAKTGHGPVAVVTTSGTAVANLHPAVLEASHAGVPLVVVTADRPARLRGTGANQTTQQPGMYAGAVRDSADVPPAVPGHQEAEQVRVWRSLVARLLATASGALGAGGPVHLNLQFGGPLTPDAPDGWRHGSEGRGIGSAWTAVESGKPGAEPVDLTSDVPTVVVAGDDAGPPARILAERAGWPLLAEPTSGSRTGDNALRTYRLLLADPDLGDRVGRVVVAGHPTLSRPVTRLLSRTDVEVVALTPPGSPTRTWTDPGHTVARVVEAATASPCDPAWLGAWKSRDAEMSQRLDALLDGWAGLTPHHVAGEVAHALPAKGLLVVGSSNPIRDLDLMVPRYPPGEARKVIANRGLSGIDGTISTAVGAALGRPQSSRALALMGDVTFVHDLTGLVVGPDEPRPDLTLVVVNDDGGSIFSLLEQGAAEHRDSFERLFATPHGVDLAALCAAVGVAHRRVSDRGALGAALAEEPHGITVVEAVVRRTDRRALDEAIRALAVVEERTK